ncbi:LysR family transcriptional regulator [Ottowia thiooxydans]|uniref:LysR family transcriptional regulator n=1 Tax=Ottowia thiooxydans TaxID=219182 RepID=UPI00049024A6|nr:LysR family transcriptional regulator [Ottowia thiooxydans]
MNITLRQLRVFCAVYERRSFTLAAEDMHMTQSAVSKLCAELEAEIGLSLFERTTRRIVPCDGAADLYEYAQEVLNTMRIAGRRLSALRTLDRGSVSIAASPMVSYGLLTPVIERFHTAHPGVTLNLHELTTDESLDYVRTGKCDLGLISVSTDDPQLLTKVVYAEPLYLACPAQHTLVQQRSVNWEDIASLTHVTLRNVYSTRRTIERILKARGLELHTAIQAGTLATALKLVQGNLGVTLIPSYAKDFAAELGLKVLEIEGGQNELHEISLVSRRGLKLSIAALAFIEALESRLSALQAT